MTGLDIANRWYKLAFHDSLTVDIVRSIICEDNRHIIAINRSGRLHLRERNLNAHLWDEIRGQQKKDEQEKNNVGHAREAERG